MSSDKFLGDFHQPTSGKHPTASIGNQQIWPEGGRQVGAIEYIPNGNGELVRISTPEGTLLPRNL